MNMFRANVSTESIRNDEGMFETAVTVWSPEDEEVENFSVITSNRETDTVYGEVEYELTREYGYTLVGYHSDGFNLSH